MQRIIQEKKFRISFRLIKIFILFQFRYLENEGIEYLRTYLHLPSEIVPSTLKRAARSEPARARPSATPRSGDASKTGEDRSAYRRAPGGAGGLDKKGDVGAGTGDVEFVSCANIHIFIKAKRIVNFN